jgi:hypothetical protein
MLTIALSWRSRVYCDRSPGRNALCFNLVGSGRDQEGRTLEEAEIVPAERSDNDRFVWSASHVWGAETRRPRVQVKIGLIAPISCRRCRLFDPAELHGCWRWRECCRLVLKALESCWPYRRHRRAVATRMFGCECRRPHRTYLVTLTNSLKCPFVTG